MNTQQAQPATHSPAIRGEWPGLPGSKYAGIAAGEGGAPDFHLVLLADKPARELNWKDAIAWAEGIGAALPTRDESALLYAHLRGEFESGWHWTGTQYSSSSAWGQGFGHGTQSDSYKSYEGRCRAVRRFPLQSFGTSVLSDEPKTTNTTNGLLRQLVDETKALRTDLRTALFADMP